MIVGQFKEAPPADPLHSLSRSSTWRATMTFFCIFLMCVFRKAFTRVLCSDCYIMPLPSNAVWCRWHTVHLLADPAAALPPASVPLIFPSNRSSHFPVPPRPRRSPHGQVPKLVEDHIRRPRLPPAGRWCTRATCRHARGLCIRIVPDGCAGWLGHGRVLGIRRAVLLARVLDEEQEKRTS